MIMQSAIIDKRYYEFDMQCPLTVGNGFIFEGSHYGISAIINDFQNNTQIMIIHQL